MRVNSLNTWRRRGVLHLAMALALVFAAAQDVGHAHAAGPEAPPCYLCHSSADLGVAPDAAHLDLPGTATPSAAPRRIDTPRHAPLVPYEAQGPPLTG